MRKKRSNISSDKKQRGATVVEFAIIASLLFLILMGIMEFGFYFMQQHFVANAARESLRVGIRANNYNSISALPFVSSSQSSGCNGTTDRALKVDCTARDYLRTLYPDRTATVTVDRTDTDGIRTLVVTVEEENFFPELLTGFIPGFGLPSKISFTASGEYENSDEE